MLPRLSLTRRSAAALTAGVPAVFAAAALAWPCDYPDHVGTHAGVGGHAHAAEIRSAPVAHASNAHHHGAGTPSAPAATSTNDEVAVAAAAGFEVGTAERPIVARGPQGALWRATPPATPGRASHGSFAEITVAEQLDALRTPQAGGPDAPADPTATRAAVLTTAQATKKLSRRCQKLLKAKKSKLSKADRKRRTACIAQRRKLVDASKKPAPTTGVTAPTAPIQGPKPTTTAPTPTEPTPTRDTPTPTTPAPTTPEKVYAAAGLRPTDSDPAKWIISRTSAKADIVNFELDNTDRQVHNLWIAPGNANSEVTGPLVEVIGNLGEGERKAVDVALKPGIYILICTIPGHDAMQVKFTVYAP